MEGIVVLGVTLAVGALIGITMRRHDGRLRPVRKPATTLMKTPVPVEAPVLTSDEIGAALGERATLVQFSTAFCQPCRATRRVLGEVAEMVPGVRHVEIDAESRLDLVRRFGIMRTPTVFIVDESGNIVKRAAGQPRKADVIAAIGATMDTSSHQSDSV